MFISQISGASDSVSLKIAIRGFNAENGLVAQKEVQNVLFYSNRKTVLSGALFTSSGAGGFKIRVNPVWEEDMPVITF